MSRLRILLLGPDCNPEKVSIGLVTYSHAAALAELHDVTLVARSPNQDAIRRTHSPFRAVEVVRMPMLEAVFAWGLRNIFKYDFSSHALTAFRWPFHVVYELRAWRQLKPRVAAGEFDVVLRLSPMTAVIPSPFAFFLRNGPIPFVIGPLQAALPFLRGFSQAKRQKKWIDRFRNVYRVLPFAGSTYVHAAAIIAASSRAYDEFASHRDKTFFIPEPGVGLSLFTGGSRNSAPGCPLDLVFVGGLIPCKACDLGLRAAAPLLREGLARFSVIGDGPERDRLERLVEALGVAEAVSFSGWLTHEEAVMRMRSADVLVFPSVRDNGAGVVFEALASGAVPLVADFGGPGDIVHAAVGYKVPLTCEGDLVSQMGSILRELAGNRALLDQLRERGRSYAREHLTWDAKARNTTEVLNWVVGRAPKPVLLPPRHVS